MAGPISPSRSELGTGLLGIEPDIDDAILEFYEQRWPSAAEKCELTDGASPNSSTSSSYTPSGPDAITIS